MVAIDASRSHSGGWNKYGYLVLVSGIAALMCLPYIRNIYWLGDEGVLLHGADRMLRGRTIYNDFFEFLPPGGFVLTEAWFSVAGVSFASERLLALLTIIGIACFTFLACRRVSKDTPLSVLLTTGWLITSQASWPTQLSHHWFTTLFSMVVAWASIVNLEARPRGSWWPMVAGAAAGAAAMVTPTRGLLAAMAGATASLNFRTHRWALVAYGVGLAIAPAGLLAYLVSHHALVAAFDDVIRFTGARYRSIQGLPFGSGATRLNLPLKFLFPFLALFTLLICARDWRGSLRDPMLPLCVAFGLAGFVGCFPRPDLVHIAFAAPLALPLLAFCIRGVTEGRGSAARYTAAAIVIAVFAPAAVRLASNALGASSPETASTPRGDVAFLGRTAIPELLRRIAATPAEDGYFFYPYMPMLPFLAAREHVSNYDIFTPGYTLPSQYRDACLSATRSASWVVIDRNWTDPKTLKQVWPNILDAQPPETRRIGLVAVWSGSRAANPCRMAGLAPSRMFLGSAEKGRFFVPA